MARILIIDDEEPVRVVLRTMLEQAGYEVVEAADAGEGLSAYQQAPTDVVLTDLFMPGQDELAILGAFRRMDPQVKLVAMSGGGQSGQRDVLRLAATLGAQHTLQKPFKMQELLATMRALIAEA